MIPGEMFLMATLSVLFETLNHRTGRVKLKPLLKSIAGERSMKSKDRERLLEEIYEAAFSNEMNYHG